MKHLAAALCIIASGHCLADDNPFMKPDQRPQVAPVVQPNATTAVAPVVPAVDPAILDSQLIAIINGEEVWFKKTDKIYFRKKATEKSLEKLNEDNTKLPEPATDLPVIAVGAAQQTPGTTKP